MESLSNLFKKTDIFKHEFDKLFPANPFNKVNILRYVTVCTEILLAESRKKYSDHHLKYINPVFVVDRDIFPSPDLPGDPTIAKLARLSFDLVQSNTVIPLSLPVIENLLSGVCLFSGDTFKEQRYTLFPAYDLDSIHTDIAIRSNDIYDLYYADDLKGLTIGVSQIIQPAFMELADQLHITKDEDKVRLIKTLILYKSLAKLVNESLVFSFVNKFNQTLSFFDCMLTLVSGRPFDEDILLDFAHVTEGISLPIANYDYSKSKGISSQTMAKRNSLKSIMVKSFKRV